MSEITKKEEGIFLMLFNRNGYVLNFSTADFDVLQQIVLVLRCVINMVFRRENP